MLLCLQWLKIDDDDSIVSFGDDSCDTRLATAPSPIASDEETVHGIH